MDLNGLLFHTSEPTKSRSYIKQLENW